MAMATVNNGVNVQALLDAREALKGAPEAAKFTWRASCKWQNGTHSKSKVQRLLRARPGAAAQDRDLVRSGSSGDLRVGGSRHHPDRVRARRARELPDGRRRGGRAEPRHPAALGRVEARRASMDIRGILGIDSDVRNGYDDIKVTFKIDADASKKDIEALVAQSQKRSAVYDVITNPRERHRRSGLGAPSNTFTTVVIGAGHAGLAASRCLTERSIDHVVLERGEVANSWRRERWDSLRLLTPNWQSRLPGHRVRRRGSGRLHDDGRGDRRSSRASPRCRTHRCARTRPSPRCRPTDSGYHVATSTGDLRCRTVVLASGACNVPSVPAVRQAVPASVRVLHRHSTTATRTRCRTAACWSSARRRPACSSPTKFTAPAGRSRSRSASTCACRGCIAGATCCGGWTRRACGTSATTEIDDLTRARRLPSPQLVGTPERVTLDLNALSATGVDARRPPLGGARRPRAVFGRAAQSVRAGRSQDGPPARHVRRMGARPPPRRRRGASRTLRADPRAGVVAARARSAPRRDPIRSCGPPDFVPTTAGSTCR